MLTSRREFIRDVSAGAAGFLLAQPGMQRSAMAKRLVLPPSTVSFLTGANRRQMMVEVLTPLKSAIQAGIQNKQILIKPNMVVHDTPLTATHVDAARGVLDFLKQITDQTIIVGESSARDTLTCFRNYGYNALTSEYNVTLLDLNQEQTVEQEGILTLGGGTTTIKIIKHFYDADTYIISLCRMKTHNNVVATLTTKNILMASPLKNDAIGDYKVKMHGGEWGDHTHETVSRNMFTIAQQRLPDLAVIDGFENMEGCGPVPLSCGVSPVEHRVALAGTDAIAVDRVGVELMGIDPGFLPYIKWCGDAGLGNYDMGNITVNGPSISDHIIKYKLHDNIDGQLKWSGITAARAKQHPPRPTLFLGSRNVLPYGSPVFNFALAVRAPTRLRVSDMRGRAIRELVADELEAGRYSVRWDGRDGYGSRVPRGAYVTTLHVGGARTSTVISHLR